MTTFARAAVVSCLASSAAVAWSGAALADSAGDKVLATVDAAAARGKTHRFEYEVTSQESGKAERKLAFTLLAKGEKGLLEYTAPADMKGTKVLILSASQIYVFLPAFGKVRRIASNVSGQGFLGMTFSADDFATTGLAGAYSAQIASETPTEWKLVATPKPGQTAPHAKIELTVAKDKALPTALAYFDAAAVKVRTETRASYSCEGDVCTPGTLEMTDHARGGARTRLVRKTWKVNEEIPDDVFTKRSLGE